MRAPLNKFFAAAFVLMLWNALPALGQTSVALSVLGSFKPNSSNAVTRQIPANSAGFMLELRHISSPLFGYDVAYPTAEPTSSTNAPIHWAAPDPPALIPNPSTPTPTRSPSTGWSRFR